MPEQQAQRLCPCPRREQLSEGSDFGVGCDQTVRSILGWDKPKDLKRVNWNGVPLDGAWRGFRPLVLNLCERQAKGDWDAATD